MAGLQEPWEMAVAYIAAGGGGTRRCNFYIGKALLADVNTIIDFSCALH